MEKLESKYIGKDVPSNKVEPRLLLAQRSSEAKVALAEIELKKKPVATYGEEAENEKAEEAYKLVTEIDKPKLTRRRKSMSGYEKPKSTTIPMQ